jgi:hypothetical protein
VSTNHNSNFTAKLILARIAVSVVTLTAFFALLTAIAGCTSNPQTEEFAFGDVVKAVEGPYRKSRIVISSMYSDDYKAPCEMHKYVAKISRNGISTEALVCHENLRATGE